VPDVVNADAWLAWVDGEHIVRQVNRQGEVSVDLRTYYVSSKLAGQAVTLRINAAERCLQVVHPQEYRRSLPRVWLASALSVLSGLCRTHAAGGLHTAAPARFAEATESPARLLLALI
jgi:hypothetical protein